MSQDRRWIAMGTRKHTDVSMFAVNPYNSKADNNRSHLYAEYLGACKHIVIASTPCVALTL